MPNMQSNTDQLKIMLLNCCSLIPKLGELKELIKLKQHDIYCFTETWLNKFIPKFHNYSAEWRNREGQGGGGVGILIHRTLEYRNLPLIPFQNGHLEVIAIKIFINKNPVDILTLYNPNKNVTVEEFKHYINQLADRYIIVGDFNAHSNILNSSTNRPNQTGKALEDILTSENLNMINPTDFFTYTDRRTGVQSCLDLCITTPDLHPLATISCIEDVGSDHKPVEILFNVIPIKTKIFNSRKWIINSTSLSNFSKSYIESEIQMPNDINSLAFDLVSRINISAESNFKCTNPFKNTKSKSTPWWNWDCAEAVKRRRKAHRLFVNHPTTENKIEYSKLTAISKNTIINAKRSYMKEFISSLKHDTPQGTIWKKLKAFKGNNATMTTPLLKEGNPVLESNEKANLLCQYLTDKNNQPVRNENFENTISDACETECSEFFNLPIKDSEVTAMFQCIKIKTPGPDQISNDMIKSLHPKYLEELIYIYNQSLATGEFPKSWKTSSVLPILKPGKDPGNVSSYRPISLLSCLGKLFERVICKRLQHYIEAENLLSSSQYGFRPNKSTNDVLLQLEDQIRRSQQNSQYCGVVYLDLQGAFDCVWNTGLLYKLSHCNIKGKLLRWLKSYLSNRTFRVIVDGQKSNESVSNIGVPQGAVLSPSLFNIMMRDFPMNNKCKTYIFADDITILTISNSPQQMEVQLQNYLNQISVWAQTWGFIVNPNKTTFQYFSSKKWTPIQIHFNDSPILHVKEQRLLGLILDSPNLTWNKHVEKLKTDCIRRISIMKTIASINSGASFYVLRLFYQSYIRTKICYGATTFGSIAMTHMRKLEAIQNACLRLMLGARKTSPILSLQAEASIPPLNMYIQYLTGRDRIKLLHRPKFDKAAELVKEYRGVYGYNPSRKVKFGTRSKQFLDTLNFTYSDRRYYCVAPIMNPTEQLNNYITYETDKIEVYNQESVQAYLFEYFHEYTAIFTDGSKVTEEQVSVSSGIHIPSLEYGVAWRVNPDHSVIGAELFAIKQALLFIKKHLNENCIILTDSKSSLQLLLGTPKKYKEIAFEIQKLLILLNTNYSVHLHWVKAHCGVLGNENADRIANLGHNLNKSALFPLSLEEKLSVFKSKFVDHWNHLWLTEVEDTGKGKHLQMIRGRLNTPPPASFSDRRDEVNMFRLRIGHAGLGKYLYRIGYAEDDQCDFCQEDETVEHYLLDCMKYDEERIELCTNIARILNFFPPLNLKLILGGGPYNLQSNSKILYALRTFLNTTKRNLEI